MTDRFKKYRHTDRGRYTRHKANAKRRGVPFVITFDDWLRIWKFSHLYGTPGAAMCRYRDQGAYEVSNVYIGTRGRNCRDRNFNYGPPRRVAAHSGSGES